MPPHVMERRCVGALIVRRDEGLEVLLGRRSPIREFFPNVWDLPGGHCEPDEPSERALFRELDEEIGVVPTTWRLLGELEIALEDHTESMGMHVYEVTAWLGRPHNRQLVEHSEVAWFTIDQACSLALAHPAYAALIRSLACRAPSTDCRKH